MFEAELGWWYEAGAIENVIISGNNFDKCQNSNGGWGESIIEFVPRKQVVDGEYFHGRVEIVNNKFITEHREIAKFDNIREVVLNNNDIEIPNDPKVSIYHCGKVDIQKNIKVKTV